jgi:hypothetical protein
MKLVEGKQLRAITFFGCGRWMGIVYLLLSQQNTTAGLLFTA